ncbi:oxoglutarate dehydrogenase (succinyl-transferring), E1 component [Batrachochytrium salamandrivorans]|nr:oxoglutarate dehydrogenase (succinyl-transferring), E1 component [Batrachochytrium salamandrivorans]
MLKRALPQPVSKFFPGARQFCAAAAPPSPPHPSESFLSGANSNYADEMYSVWKRDPTKVHASWDAFFRNVDNGVAPGQAFMTPGQQPLSHAASTTTRRTNGASAKDYGMTGDDGANIIHMIRGYQARGHLKAKLDPLGLQKPDPVDLEDLRPEAFGFAPSDASRVLNIPNVPGVGGILDGKLRESASLDLVNKALHATYCGTVGVEYMHIPNREKMNFIRSRIEKDFPQEFDPDRLTWGRFLTKEERIRVMDRLHFAEMFEKFLAKRWNTAKRFGLEGCESVIPGMKMFVDRASELGAKNFVIGMPHRGRLNVLTNVMRKPLEDIYTEFHGTHVDPVSKFQESIAGYANSGDVKYHMGFSYSREYPDGPNGQGGRTVNLSLLANPSHLEAVNPVATGKTRAKQHYAGDATGERSVCILMHGDAAFAGQGVVYETMQMMGLPNYKTGGTLHIVVNNQIGFTTIPKDSRSTPYATDLGKAFNCPIFHCNADDPDSVAYCFKIAAEWRQKYLSDVIVDVIGYRRMGHNEMDEARFTQPTMYEKISKHPSVLEVYKQRCLADGLFTEEDFRRTAEHTESVLEKAYVNAKSGSGEEKVQSLSNKWVGLLSPKQHARIKDTAVDVNTLREIGEACFGKVPHADFAPHRNVKKILNDRLKAVQTGQGIDWGTAEHLAFGSLCLEGNHVRLSGQDVQRGTFSHRHCLLHDFKTDEEYVPLNHLGKGQAQFHACNSHLSEYAVSGFELGYSLEDPNALVIWEAQFGDFSNGAQIIMDQFISCGETKWNRQSGLVWLLPHGYDGQGPEHSSSRLERFLQLSDEGRDTVPERMSKEDRMQIQQSNMQICNVTTPAQLFHLLRRQVHRQFRKPLVVASPKMLLKHKECVSAIEDFGPGTSFHRVLFETEPRVNELDKSKIRKLIFVTGKLYYHLTKRREESGNWDVAIVRIEQISPFPYDRVAEAVKMYPNAELVYAQEEPLNMGAWFFVDDRIYTATRVLLGEGKRCLYVGRKAAASPASGYGKVHDLEQNDIVHKAME